MTNMTVHFYDNVTKAQGWISQNFANQMFGMIIMLPKGTRQFPNGGNLMEIQTSDIHYSVQPDASGNDECECGAFPFVPYWWWVPVSQISDPPSPAKGLSCWGSVARVDEEVCVRENMPTIPVQEYRVMVGPDLAYLQFDHYQPDKFNSTLLAKPKACLNKQCNMSGATFHR